MEWYQLPMNGFLRMPRHYPESHAEAALVLVCKRPGYGIGKQRLAATLGREAANQVAQSLLRCALEDAHDWPGPVIVAPAHPQDHSWAETLLTGIKWKGRKVHVLPQTTGNLGQRLNILDLELRQMGLEQLVYIGSDAPSLNPVHYAEVRDALQQTDTVLIPAEDGGVVLMASRQNWPVLSDLPWSTAHLGAGLARRCSAAGRSITILKHGYDVDEHADLARLVVSLALDPRPARRALHKLACSLVQSLKEAYVPF